MLPGRVGRVEEGRCILFVACFKENGFRVSIGLGTTKRCWELGRGGIKRDTYVVYWGG